MPLLSLEPVAAVLPHTGQSIVLYHLVILGLPLQASHRTKKPVTQRSVVRAAVMSATPCEAACGDGDDHKSRVTAMSRFEGCVTHVVRLLRMQQAYCDI